jgi:hypothetical protein
MAYEDRKSIIRKIELLRGGRRLISICNFDRAAHINRFSPLVNTDFKFDLKECLYRVLKESKIESKGVDIFLYTRGGDTNAVWPIVSLIREFDPEFEVLIPYRAHSAGTLLSLAAKVIHMTRLAELSPVDPTIYVSNGSNEQNFSHGNGIDIEDVNFYKRFIAESLRSEKTVESEEKESSLEMREFIHKLVDELNPVTLGDVHRTNKYIEKLAEKLINCNKAEKETAEIVQKLTEDAYSHNHMFNRHEMKEILDTKIQFTSSELEEALDELLKDYEDTFLLRDTFFIDRYLGNELEKNFRFISSAVESEDWGYLFETRGILSQVPIIPDNVNIQLTDGEPIPLIDGLERNYQCRLHHRRWMHNTEQLGINT